MLRKSLKPARLLMLILALSLIDGGVSFFCIVSNSHHVVLTGDDRHKDLEVTDFHLSSFLEDARIGEAPGNKVDLPCPSIRKIVSEKSQKTRDFSGLIWQPPKSAVS